MAGYLADPVRPELAGVACSELPMFRLAVFPDPLIGFFHPEVNLIVGKNQTKSNT
ncbi:hypothetical protein [Pseudophaeobacter sp.]|uniref:hypothetical protein n=1 Tax=Pseudophaeobacter sp. TaxID=1971739 RepID=UPI0032995640